MEKQIPVVLRRQHLSQKEMHVTVNNNEEFSSNQFMRYDQYIDIAREITLSYKKKKRDGNIFMAWYMLFNFDGMQQYF